MKLVTHNMLSSKGLKGVRHGFPLTIKATDVRVSDVDFNPEFVARIIPKLDWRAVCQAASDLNINQVRRRSRQTVVVVAAVAVPVVVAIVVPVTAAVP